MIPTNYNRRAAVDYARKWWNGRNPNYPAFAVDCTSFISQCLLAGGAPMRGAPDRGKGWWITGGWRGSGGHYSHETWSYSWSVSHSLRWYLETSTTGLTAKQVASASELQIGDVIFYDFQGTGVIDHSTIVTSIRNGIPYVHAHTNDSENRHYQYRNSGAYTPNIKYYFYRISDVFH